MPICRLCLLIVSALALVASSAFSQEPSASDIVNALDPAVGVPKRSWSKRGVIVKPGATAIKSLSIDLYVNFPYDSSELTTDSEIILRKLATALRDSRLSEYRFAIIGHTDAKGTNEYNLELSNRRAAAVSEYLVLNGIARDRLMQSGMGELELIDRVNPESEINRRVQVLNLSASHE